MRALPWMQNLWCWILQCSWICMQYAMALKCSLHSITPWGAFTKYEQSKILHLNESSGASFTLQPNQESGQVSFEFRTRLADQLLYTSILANNVDRISQDGAHVHVAIYLTNGSVQFNVENYFQNGVPYAKAMELQQKVHCLSDYGTCADVQWHRVKQRIVKNSLLISIDNQAPFSYALQYTTLRLHIKSIHLGHHPSARDEKLFGSGLNVPRQRFRGCIRRLRYNIRDRQITPLDEEKQDLLKVHLSQCELKDYCATELLTSPRQQLSFSWPYRSGSHYASFIKPGGYLRVPGWHAVLTGELAFRLRTTELNGLLIYGSSVNLYELINYPQTSSLSDPIPGAGKAGFDIFALELRDGYLFCVINTGSGSVQLGQTSLGKSMAGVRFLADGNEHTVDIHFDQGSISVQVDNQNYMAHTADEKTYKYLNLNGIFYIGGLPEAIRQVGSFISPEVWSTRLRWDYIGCLGDVRIDGRLWDVELETRACWAQTHVRPQCQTQPATMTACPRDACANHGRCRAGWNRFICDCHDTDFTGETCSEEPTVAEFNGHQWMAISFTPFPIQSTVEDLVIRFRTKQQYGLLLTTKNSAMAASDCLEIQLQAGYLQLMYNFGEESKRYKSPFFVSDYLWHTVRIARRERYLNFTVDQSAQVYDIPKDGRFLSHKEIILGRGEKIWDSASLDAFPDRPLMLSPAKTKLTMFIGHIMTFWFNGLDFLQVAKQLLTNQDYGIWRDKMEITASNNPSSTGQMLEFPLSLEAHDSYIEMRLPIMYNQIVLEFWLKTDKNFGIILLLDSSDMDIVGLELVNGNLNIVGNLTGDSNNVQSKRHGALIDSKWHRVQLTRTWGRNARMTVQVDQEIITTDLLSIDIQTRQELFLGGVPKTRTDIARYKNTFHSMYGFSGCVASIQIQQFNRSTEQSSEGQVMNRTNPSASGRVTTLFSHGPDALVKWNKVEPGCRQKPNGLKQSLNGNCTPKVCHFGGRCVQLWGATRCDCSMTSLTGTHCTTVDSAVHISVIQGSIISFEMNPPQNTTRDQLAFGLQVINPGPIVLLLIQGQGDSPDYLEVSIVKLETRHVLLVRYNMGAGQHTLYEPNVDVTDGQYHIIQFVRDGPSAVLRVDLEHERANKPNTKQGIHFNGVKQIRMGFAFKNFPSSVQNTSNPKHLGQFDGFMTGVYFNEVNLISILNGLVIPGIFLSERKNIRIEKQFAPKMEHLNNVRIRNDIHNQITANDMKLQTNDEGTRSRDAYSGPLIIAKRDCVDPGGIYDAKMCSPYDRLGIIQPHVEFKRTSVTDGAKIEKSRAVDRGSDWNADQSKLRQTQPNDSGANHYDGSIGKNSKSGQPSPSWSSSSAWYKDYDHKFPDSPAQRINPSDMRPENNYADNELGLSPRKQFALNIGLIASVSVGGICVLIALTCVIYRCTRRDEGSYNVDENLAYTGETNSSNAASEQTGRMPKRETSIPMNVLTSMNCPIQTTTATVKSALVVTFSDNCKELVPAISAIGAHSATPTEFVSSKQELLSSPSIHSGDSSIKRSRLVKIEPPATGRTTSSAVKTKKTKLITDSQEWYV